MPAIIAHNVNVKPAEGRSNSINPWRAKKSEVNTKMVVTTVVEKLRSKDP